MNSEIRKISADDFILRAVAPWQQNRWSVAVSEIFDQLDQEDPITEMQDMLTVFAAFSVVSTTATAGPEELLRAIDESSSDYLLLHNFENWSEKEWRCFDGFRHQLNQGKQGGTLCLTEKSLRSMLSFAPNFASWVGNKIYQVVLNSYLLTEEQSQSRLVSLRKWSGWSDAEVIRQAESDQLPPDPEYAEWLILLDRGDLVGRH
jgi:hypothetical protein